MLKRHIFYDIKLTKLIYYEFHLSKFHCYMIVKKEYLYLVPNRGILRATIDYT